LSLKHKFILATFYTTKQLELMAVSVPVGDTLAVYNHSLGGTARIPTTRLHTRVPALF